MGAWEAYSPVLNEEHTAWEWVCLRDLLEKNKTKGKKLHPVVLLAVEEYGNFLSETLL